MSKIKVPSSSIVSAMYGIAQFTPEQLMSEHSHPIRLPGEETEFPVDTYQQLYRDAISIDNVFKARQIEDIVPDPALVVRPALARSLRAFSILYPPEPYAIPSFWKKSGRWYEHETATVLRDVGYAVLYSAVTYSDVVPGIDAKKFKLIPTPERSPEEQLEFIRQHSESITFLMRHSVFPTEPKLKYFYNSTLDRLNEVCV